VAEIAALRLRCLLVACRRASDVGRDGDVVDGPVARRVEIPATHRLPRKQICDQARGRRRRRQAIARPLASPPVQRRAHRRAQGDLCPRDIARGPPTPPFRRTTSAAGPPPEAASRRPVGQVAARLATATTEPAISRARASPERPRVRGTPAPRPHQGREPAQAVSRAENSMQFQSGAGTLRGCPAHPHARCQRPSVSPQRRSSNVPTGGHVFSPLVAIGSPRLSSAPVVAEPSP
jgi:hypothetical protein